MPRGSMLYSKPVDGVPCRFRTCYPTTLWPVTVSEAQWSTPDRLEPPLQGAGRRGGLPGGTHLSARTSRSTSCTCDRCAST